MANNKIIVVGGGLAGLMATIKAAEKGAHVDLFSLVPVKRSHSVCAQGGINGAVNTKGEGDSTLIHFDDTVYGGDFLANQTPVKNMTAAAPSIIHLLDRMGVMFNRTPEGLLDFRRFGGTLYHRTAFAGATTGQQLLYALDEQVRSYEVKGLVTKYEGWEFLGIVKDDEDAARGIVAQNLTDSKIEAFGSDAVIMATGGPGIIFGKSTNSMINTGSAASVVYQQGAKYANGEFIQIHPTAIPGDDKLRLMSESARGEGGRIWTYKDGKPWYFLEEKYPDYGNLVPRDIATREIFDVCVNQKLGINGENMVYLDLSHKDAHELDVKLGGIIEIYEKFTGDDPRKVPMKIFPAVHYSMGGIWVDFDQMTNIKGLFAAGECDYSQHGGNRLGANSLLSAIYGGMVAGPNAMEYVKNIEISYTELGEEIFQKRIDEEQEKFDHLLNLKGTENAYKLHKELGEIMTANVTVVRHNDKLLETDKKIVELMKRYQNIDMEDTSTWSNQAVFFTRQLWNMLVLARVITIGAYNRNESRGAHYKPEFPERNDEEWLKTTIAQFRGPEEAPEFSYEEVDISHIKPRKRDYSKKSEGSK
ncbi:succinate dehydrogenase flavoprotein subunit [Mammaliicoccus vitulinus]|uniref:succinate dehydrogenase flavoprotein subunit n=1 Tax=Mammaliicoccus vitulinus TaxID=71237 RepID=UPI000D1D4363|nr:succinate dehydrogenase flavoprotein subunit [Mammaliicoccus vitulinus]PTI88426.1 succinate dehydrogenase flavoprotein subunit [Mammaliicoccus vitulinus]QQT15907.1 succinate dehydrogenase flavoprotein subunit [Mammaliicoccus vitulinus]QQY18796.1 succinate dehydrogenase flavoprotein subunit [Mammaliicoccus vitulinus]RTX87808.1 succinate dehydrogenase flavoprotein subunit [Mammaliicoccus vitulinus]GGH99659.1 succinate dehydrogenase flavoprotein subunit [Mammaliicoccus vitulinus]